MLRKITGFSVCSVSLGCLVTSPVLAIAESVDVKYRGTVSLDRFSCTDISRSSTVERVCYDEQHEYMLIKLDGTYYHYCEIPAHIVDGLLSAPSMGTYYGQHIKGTGLIGPFDCRTRKVPNY